MTDFNAIDSSLKPALQRAEQVASDKEKLKKATREFEGYFIGAMLKKMHESAAKGGLFGQKSEAGLYREMFDDAVAKEIGKQGRLGIADMLYRRMERLMEAREP
jgi:Rod binding domain-containing protein